MTFHTLSRLSKWNPKVLPWTALLRLEIRRQFAFLNWKFPWTEGKLIISYDWVSRPLYNAINAESGCDRFEWLLTQHRHRARHILKAITRVADNLSFFPFFICVYLSYPWHHHREFFTIMNCYIVLFIFFVLPFFYSFYDLRIQQSDNVRIGLEMLINGFW